MYRQGEMDDQVTFADCGKGVVRLRNPLTANSLPIRGRAKLVALADDLLAKARCGQGSLMVVEGPPGIGKSRLVREVLSRAELAGARALWGKACEDQQMVPFGPLFEAVLRVPPICDADKLRELSARDDSRFWVVRDLQSAIAVAAADAPVCIAIDDVQWADAGTVVALHALLTALASAPVVWIFALRSAGGRTEVRDAISAMVSARGASAHVVHLGALDGDAVAEMAADVLGVSVDQSVVRLADLAHGNPFLVLELLRGLHEENRIQVERGRASASGRSLPQRLAATMHRRLDRLTEAARHAVQVASVLPEGFSAELLARVLGASPCQMARYIDEAIRADLLTADREQLRFRHDLLRQATRQTIPYALRKAMERESATALLELGAAPEEVATLLMRSAEIGDTAAVTSLRQAAEALSRSDPSAAADLSRRALDLLRADDGARAAVVAETVVLLNQASRYVEAQQLATATLSSDLPEEDEANIRLSLSIASSLWPGRRAEVNRLALQMPGLSAEMRARHLGWLAYNLVLDGQKHAVREPAQAALNLAAEIGDLQARLIAESAMANVDCIEGRVGCFLQRMETLQPRMWAADGGVVGMVATAVRANLLITVGRLAEATAAVSDGAKNARRLWSSAGAQAFDIVQALCELAAGRLTSARTIIETHPENERLRAESVVGRHGLLIMGAIAAHTDDRPLLRQVGIAARAAFDGGPAVRREAMATLAQAAWQRGDNTEAARWLGEDGDLLTTPMWPLDLDHVVLAARLARALGDAGLRQRVMDAVETLEHGDRKHSLFSAVALHVRGLLENDVDILDAAVWSLAESERPLLHAGAVEDMGNALAGTANRDLAVEHLSSAFDIFSAHECSADARRVARALNSFGVHRRMVRQRERTGWDSLTESELRVMELVADGATNRQAAEQLYISPHTVSAHLRKVFAKLGVHSRAELVALARGR